MFCLWRMYSHCVVSAEYSPEDTPDNGSYNLASYTASTTKQGTYTFTYLATFLSSCEGTREAETDGLTGFFPVVLLFIIAFPHLWVMVCFISIDGTFSFRCCLDDEIHQLAEVVRWLLHTIGFFVAGAVEDRVYIHTCSFFDAFFLQKLLFPEESVLAVA